MARGPRGPRGRRTNQRPRFNQADEIKRLINRGVALEVEMLGAAIQVWSRLVEYTTRYSRQLNNELLKISAGDSDANGSIRQLVEFTNRELSGLEGLPETIAQNFRRNVRRRARAGREVE
jgi:hypothetical protein